MKQQRFQIHTISSMEKIFVDQETVTARELQSLSALKGECVSFQIAVKMQSQKDWRAVADCRAYAKGEWKDWVQIRRVDFAPSQFAAYPYQDDNYLRTAPGLYPDILRETTSFRCTGDQWKCLWISVWIPQTAVSGEKEITICLTEEQIRADGSTAEEKIADVTLRLHVIDAVLPEQRVIHTEWFHSDCLADYYGVPVLSEEWWRITENFVKMAVKHGMNMILTPIFTPPLDTAVGGERTTVQLVGIRKEKNGYQFDFSALERWVAMCRKAGMVWFEMAHLFTQWGAAFTPKIMVTVDGREEKMFGWHVRADDPSYRQFLQEFLPALTEQLKRMGIADKTVFHVSDEPNEEMLAGYQKSKALVETLLDGFPIIDALSYLEFYQRGIISHPIPSNDCIEPFLEAKVPGLWTYYCCAQWNQVSNRYFSMPGARTRIIGAQLYRCHMAGFLHWGYNFYNTQFSKEHISPYEVTDAGNAFPSGDAFLVYPGKNGVPEASIRLMLMLEAMQDIRALDLLETLAGRAYTERILMEKTEKLTFSEYPKEASWLLAMRERVNEEISRRSGGMRRI